jgi:hypothetical protein
MKTMKVIAVSDVKQDKNGRDYKVVTLSNPSVVTMMDVETGELITAKVPPLKSKVTAYKETYLDDTPSFLWDAVEGETVLGSVVTRKVPVYDISDGDVSRKVETYTCAVVANSDDSETWEVAIEKAFKNNGHPLNAEDAQTSDTIKVSLSEPETEEEEAEVAEAKQDLEF